MRREGRIHGSYVRMSKHEEFEYNKGAPRKPTNRSRVSGCCLGGKVRCHACHTRPVLKAMCKTKGMFKLKDLDITSNHKLDGFRFNCSSRYSGLYENSSLDSGLDLRYNDCLSDPGSDCDEDYEDGADLDLWDNQSQSPSSPEMMVTIASFLRDMRGGREATMDSGTPDSTSEEETPEEATLQHGISLEATDESESDSDSWSGVDDVSDSEHFGGVDVDGWYLVG